MPSIRSAVKQGQRPVAALKYLPNPNEGWTKLDYLLQEAYHTMDQEICSICHNPIWLCHSTDNRIEFKVTTRTCYAKAELEDAEKKDIGKNLGSGEYLVAKPIGLENDEGEPDPLPNRREAYKRMQND